MVVTFWSEPCRAHKICQNTSSENKKQLQWKFWKSENLGHDIMSTASGAQTTAPCSKTPFLSAWRWTRRKHRVLPHCIPDTLAFFSKSPSSFMNLYMLIFWSFILGNISKWSLILSKKSFRLKEVLATKPSNDIVEVSDSPQTVFLSKLSPKTSAEPCCASWLRESSTSLDGFTMSFTQSHGGGMGISSGLWDGGHSVAFWFMAVASIFIIHE